MEQYIIILLCAPVAFFIATLSYQITNLFYIWVKFKLQDIKDKEYQLWD